MTGVGSATWFAGMGLVSALGGGVGPSLAALRRPPGSPCTLSVPLGGGAETIPFLGSAGAVEDDPAGRLFRMAETAAREAIDAAGLTTADLRSTALLLGTSSLDISITEDAFARDLKLGDAHPLMTNSSMGDLGRVLAKRLGVGGVDLTINTACTASANALVYGDRLVATGRASHALVLGTELFNRTTALGFKGLDLFSPHGMRPFDKDRRGIVLGEACAAVVVGRAKPSAHAFRLAGSANLCDTHGISAANPDGSTVAEVITQALALARIAPGDVKAIKSHGTASLLNDEAEAAGLKRVFGETMPTVCALKPFIGHTFGACGLAELVMMCAAASAGFIPGTPGISPAPGDLGIGVTQAATPVGEGAFLLNYFGFGGNNTALVVAND
jgi:3-oxoacyl-[acyl-carrier-protein] synthase-1